MTTTKNQDLSFVLLLVGGLLILVGGLAGVLMMTTFWPSMSGMMGGMMGGAWNAGWTTGMVWWMGGISLVTGAFVLLAAYHVRLGRETRLWSMIGIAAGAVSLLAMGGYIVGAIAAIVGGAFALTGEPQTGDSKVV
ncbi:MAG: hypothetical protein WDA16_00035 [Candidatus Thermoplasmatota archaeon]